jgi:hypothetical protein
MNATKTKSVGPVHAIQIHVHGSWRTTSVTRKGAARAETLRIQTGNAYGCDTQVVEFPDEATAWV